MKIEISYEEAIAFLKSRLEIPYEFELVIGMRRRRNTEETEEEEVSFELPKQTREEIKESIEALEEVNEEEYKAQLSYNKQAQQDTKDYLEKTWGHLSTYSDHWEQWEEEKKEHNRQKEIEKEDIELYKNMGMELPYTPKYQQDYVPSPVDIELKTDIQDKDQVIC